MLQHQVPGRQGDRVLRKTKTGEDREGSQVMGASSIHTNSNNLYVFHVMWLSPFCLTKLVSPFRFKVVSALAEIQKQRGTIFFIYFKSRKRKGER